MHDFQWIATEFLLRHLSGKLLAALIVLVLTLAVTAVLVAIELRKDRHADQ